MSLEGNPNEVPAQPEIKRKVEVVEKEQGGAENLDEYEREKMTYTIDDLERTASSMKIIMRLLDFLTKKGLEAHGRGKFDDLRYAPPGSELMKYMTEVRNKCNGLQVDISKNISQELWQEFMKSEGQA